MIRHTIQCREDTGERAGAWVRRWCRDHAAEPALAAAAASVVQEAVTHGMRFGPRSLSLTADWRDRRLGLVLTWHECSHRAASRPATAPDPQHSADLFDALTHRWGVTARGPDAQHWFVIGTDGPVPHLLPQDRHGRSSDAPPSGRNWSEPRSRGGTSER